MALFSERNGYVKISDILIKEDVPDFVSNAICPAFEGASNVMGKEVCVISGAGSIGSSFIKAVLQF